MIRLTECFARQFLHLINYKSFLNPFTYLYIILPSNIKLTLFYCVQSFAMHLILNPVTFLFMSICVNINSFSISHIIEKVAFIHLPVWKIYNTLPMLFICLPLAIITSAISVLNDPVALHLTIYIITLISGTNCFFLNFYISCFFYRIFYFSKNGYAFTIFHII